MSDLRMDLLLAVAQYGDLHPNIIAKAFDITPQQVRDLRVVIAERQEQRRLAREAEIAASVAATAEWASRQAARAAERAERARERRLKTKLGRVRNEQIFREWKAGKQQKELAATYGVSAARISQICLRGDFKSRLATRKRMWLSPPELSRVRGLPGDDHLRDVWLTYRPGPDPWMDFFEPIRVR